MSKNMRQSRILFALTAVLIVFWGTMKFGVAPAKAGRISDVRGTKHNLSAGTDPSGVVRAIKSTTETQVCVFCHTPHGAEAGVAPLWNRKLSTATYSTYSSTSLDALQVAGAPTKLPDPAGSSKLCLSCHDGTLAISTVNVNAGVQNAKIAMNAVGTGFGKDAGTATTYNYQAAGTGSAYKYTININKYDPISYTSGSGSTAVTTYSVTPSGSATTAAPIVGYGINPSNAGADYYMPTGWGANTGYTRNLGTDLTNDHPISLTYNDALASRDGELRKIQSSTTNSITGPKGENYLVAARDSRPKVNGAANTSQRRPILKLENYTDPVSVSGQIQCATCHDPHIRNDDTSANSMGNIKFLRLNRFQGSVLNSGTRPSSTGFNTSEDIICLACHDKNTDTSGGNEINTGAWAFSAHANPDVAKQTYKADASALREFPNGMPVWQAACLNCHDTHTVPGAKRLLRGGVSVFDAATKKVVSYTPVNISGKPAQEQVCYQCHVPTANSILNAPGTGINRVPDVYTDFTGAGTHMPIDIIDEKHDIGGTDIDNYLNSGGSVIGGVDCKTANKCGADFVESRGRLGTTAGNRHVECTDCHNPHRVIRSQNGLPGTLSSSNTKDTNGATHDHSTSTTTVHSNRISGVLRGMWGVEPQYTTQDFNTAPTAYTVKRGDPGPDTAIADCNGTTNKSTCDSKAYVTREYQICLKCHSSYGFGNTPPSLGYPGGTTPATNGLNTYTDVAREIQAPSGHRGESFGTGSVLTGTAAGGWHSNWGTNNHRSWHPVMDTTGRDLTARAISSKDTTNYNWPWKTPWSNKNWAAVGNQTMYCTDCHGSDTGDGSESVVPNNTPAVWGPHGSTNAFILKGDWNQANVKGASGQKASYSSNFLCFKCHDKQVYADGNSGGNGTRGGSTTGFCCAQGNMHQFHANKIQSLRCTWCHIAVPHGWKNKAFLVNLNDIGPEVPGVSAGTQVATSGSNDVYTKEPYYYMAKNKINNFKASGNWSDGDCGARTGNGTTINSTNGNSSNTTGTGKNWMTSTCKTPP